MVVTERRLTADEYLALPWEPNRQLIDGEIVVNDPSFRHQRISLHLLVSLSDWVRAERGRGEVGFGGNLKIDGRNVYVPDMWWVPDGRRPDDDAVWYEGPPVLVAEVRSPRTWKYDIGKKKDRYVKTGASELWLVDTASDTVLVYRGEDEALEIGRGEVLTSPNVADFALDLTDLFDR
jgi:Uma2 family endonuclease